MVGTVTVSGGSASASASALAGAEAETLADMGGLRSRWQPRSWWWVRASSRSPHCGTGLRRPIVKTVTRGDSRLLPSPGAASDAAGGGARATTKGKGNVEAT